MTKIFGVGTRVVCIDGKFDPFVWEFADDVPVEGGIYTISGMCFEAHSWETGNVAPAIPSASAVSMVFPLLSKIRG
jgi:hypothetical protein